jgi:[CysO sulfur-carrier protein]-S-L-cysteine hydrolase
VLDHILSRARAELPFECCGLLAGPQEIITEAFALANTLRSAHEFFIGPRDLIATFRIFRERGLKHLGIYHSHPKGENRPSRRDIEMAFYPSCAYLIISPQPSAARPIRAFNLVNGQVTELEIQTVPCS